MLDTMGREIAVKMSHEGPEDGWTTAEKTYEVDAGDTVHLYPLIFYFNPFSS